MKYRDWSNGGIEIYLRKSNPAACSEPFVGAYACWVNLAKRNTDALEKRKCKMQFENKLENIQIQQSDEMCLLQNQFTYIVLTKVFLFFVISNKWAVKKMCGAWWSRQYSTV